MIMGFFSDITTDKAVQIEMSAKIPTEMIAFEVGFAPVRTADQFAPEVGACGWFPWSPSMFFF